MCTRNLRLFVSPAAVEWPCEPLTQQTLETLNLVVDQFGGASDEWASAFLANRVDRMYTPLAAQARLSYPQPYSASPYLGVLNMPWFLDYGHLIFWFYFLSSLVIIMWLASSYGSFTRNVEARMPIRETRGFSRAQTGDVLTAVLPMTWSITMLMHATTQSTNFDENVAATAFSLTVLAYQWGWNYFFPRDIVELFAQIPKLIGRGRVEVSAQDSLYEHLLEQARADYLAKMAAQGAYASRWGRGTTSNVLNFYLRLPTILPVRAALAEAHLQAAALRPDLAAALLSPTSKLLRGLSASLDREGALRGLGAWEPAFPSTPRNWAASQKGLAAPQLRSAALLSQRAKPTLVNLGNRLAALLHHQGRFGIDRDWRWAFATAARLTTLQARVAGQPVFALPAQYFFSLPGLVTLANVEPNLWLFWPRPTAHPFSSLSLADLALPRRTLSPQSFLGRRGQLNFNKWQQTLLFGGAEFALGSTYNSLCTLEDLGPSTTTMASELMVLLGNKAVAAWTLWASAAPHARLTPVAALFAHPGDWSGRLISLYGAAAPYTAAPRSNLLTSNVAGGAFWPFAQQNAGLEGSPSGLRDLLPLAPTHPLSDIAWEACLKSQQDPKRALTEWGRRLLLLGGPYRVLVYSEERKRQRQAQIKERERMRAMIARKNTEPWAKIAEEGFRSVNFVVPEPIAVAPKPRPVKFPRWWNGSEPILTLESFNYLKDAPQPSWLLATDPAKRARLGQQFALFPQAREIHLRIICNSKNPLSLVQGGVRLCPDLPWLPGAELARPIRTGLGKHLDPAWLISRRSALGEQAATYSHPVLMEWPHSWSLQTLRYSNPLFKLSRGGYAFKPTSGGAEGAWPLRPEAQALFFAESEGQVDKLASTLTAPALTAFAVANSTPAPLFSITDKTRLPWTSIFPVTLPLPQEELDSAFVHAFWTTDINTSRRSDHVARFKITWGPFVTALLDPQATPQTTLHNLTPGLYGPSFFQGAPLRKLLQNPLYVINEALQRISAHSIPAVPQSDVLHSYLSTTGESLLWFPTKDTDVGLTLNEVLTEGALLLEEGWFLFLEDDRVLHKALWPDLWVFLSPNQQPRMAAFHANIAVSPAYHLAKALILLSTHNELMQRLQPRLLTHPLHINGARSPLFVDVASALSAHQPLNTAPGQIALAPRFSRSFWLEGFWGAWAQHVGLPWATWSGRQQAFEARVRSAFVPLKADIGAIRRLRVTKGVNFPSDQPIHLICGSKDVIHSWAIPGLGVKIDCIPGYNSHRRVLLRWRGVYWGQCMEVCGRYHHWMPILVRVSHQDIFIAWCLAYLKLLKLGGLAAGSPLTIGDELALVVGADAADLRLEFLKYGLFFNAPVT